MATKKGFIEARDRLVKDAAEFFSLTKLEVGRYTSQDGLAWDVSDAGPGHWEQGGKYVSVVTSSTGHVTLEQLGVDMSGNRDAYSRIQGAVERGSRIIGGGGTVYISQPLKPTTTNPSVSIRGPVAAPRTEADVAGVLRFRAPAGFCANPEGQAVERRRTLDVSNVHIFGSDRSTATGIFGSWGGSISNSRITDYGTIMDNGYSYLMSMEKVYLDRSDNGVILGDTNSTRIIACHFGSSMGRHFSNHHHASSKNSYPLILKDNNFNFSGNYAGGVWLSDQVIGTGNYFELFGTRTMDGPFVTYVGRRFSYPKIIWEGNHMNGQGLMKNLMRLVSDNASGTAANGSQVKGNWMRGAVESPIVIGGLEGYFDILTGIDFGGLHGNGVGSASVQVTAAGVTSKPDVAMLARSPTATGVAFTGSSFVSIPFETVTGFIQTNAVDTGISPRLRNDRGYIISVTATVESSVDVRFAEARLTVAGVAVTTKRFTIRGTTVTGGVNYEEITMFCYVPAPSALSDLRLQFRQGEAGAVVRGASMAIRETIDSEGFIG